MRILVTGAAGFIGTTLTLKLAELGHELSGVDCFDNYYSSSLKKRNAKELWKSAKVLVHHLDIAIDPLEGILDGVEAVIHLAAQPGNDANTPYDSYIKNNFYATVSLIETLKKLPTPPILIHGSTSSVYGIDATGSEETPAAPISPYGVTKLAAEAAVQSAHRRNELRSTILRFFSVYGPRERPDKLFPRLFTALKHGTQFPLYEGSREHQRSFTFVDDIVGGIILALDNFEKAQGEIINLGSPDCHTTAQALELAQQISGKSLKIKDLPARPGDQAKTHANISKAQKLLGYQPTTSLHDGLRKVWEWASRAL